MLTSAAVALLLGAGVQSGIPRSLDKPRRIPAGFSRSSRYERRRERLLRAVGGTGHNCGDLNSAKYDALEDFLWTDKDGNKRYFNSGNSFSNSVDKSKVNYHIPDNVHVTLGNGWCDSGVYESWNKCNIDGTCFKGCEDGDCHAQNANGKTKIKVPHECGDWMVECAKQCRDDAKCVAFSYRNTNVLGNAMYICNLMASLTCTSGEQDQSDPRSSYFVKGSHIEKLLSDFSVDNLDDLDKEIKKTDEFVYNHWSSWGYHYCKRKDKLTCGEGFITRTRKTSATNTEMESRTCEFRNLLGTPRS